MRHVTFATAQAPFGAGDKRLVPDEVAEELEAAGVLEANEPWPKPAPGAAAKPKRPVLQPTRPAGKPGDQRRVN